MDNKSIQKRVAAAMGVLLFLALVWAFFGSFAVVTPVYLYGITGAFAFAGIVLTGICLGRALFGEFDRADYAFRAIIFAICTVVSYKLSPLGLPYEVLYPPHWQNLAYLGFLVYVAWQMPHERPWVPHLTFD